MLQRDWIVIDCEDAELPGVQVLLESIAALPIRFLQRHCHVERRADALRALHLDMAVHQFDDALRDGQAQAGASVLAGSRGVFLAERLEDVGQILFAHADAGVLDGELQRALAVVAPALLDEERHRAAFRREFDGVAQDVDHDLLELHAVTDVVLVDGADRAAVVRNSLVGALAADDGVDLLEIVGERELIVLDDHLPRFYAGHVEDVIDDAEQVLCRGADLQQVFFDSVGNIRLVEGNVVQADDGVHGRADLVAHVGEESRLGLAGLLCCCECVR